MQSRFGLSRRLTALVLSWVIPATSVWAAAPPSVVPAARPAPFRRDHGAPLRSASAAAPAVEATDPLPVPAAAAAMPAPDLPSSGILVGQVLSDATGLPVVEATVRLAGSPESPRPVDLEGRFALPAGPGAHVVLAEKDGFVSAERRAASVAGQGTAVLDARLTPLGTPVTIGSSGGSVSAGGVSVTVGSGVVSGSTGFILTPLSPQGLPAPLPLGWSPFAAVDFRAGGTASGPFASQWSGLPAGVVLHLVEYRTADHAWHMTDDSLGVTEGQATASLPGLGAFAIVAADEAGPSVPGPGAPLTGSVPVASPAGLTGTATVEPIQVPASGATARGLLNAQSPSAVPSGTLLQARLTESFTLGSVRIEDESRLQDVIAYRSLPTAAQTLKAAIPLTAVRTFSPAEPVTGRLKLEFWTGRPSAIGSVGGGTESVTVESGPARLTVAAGSLPSDTAVSIQSVPLSAFLPGASGVTALGEVVVDLSGAVLGQGAELSLAGSASAGDTLVIAKIERLSGVPYLTVVSLAEVQGGRIVSASYSDLPGIVRGGRYVFYRIDGPIGFVAGTTSSPAGPVRAVVGTAGLPFVGVSSAAGAYITAARPGAAVDITASVPGTPHHATAPVAVTVGATSSLNLSLTAGLTTATVVPADGTTGVAVSVTVQLTASQPLQPTTVTATSVRLIKGNPDSGPTVATRRLVSADGTALSIVPEAPLEPATVFTLRIVGLKDAFGGTVSVADVHFTTRADVTPEYDLSRLKFSFPDAGGMVAVTAAQGSFPPASTVMVINERNGAVLTATVGNQGELSAELPATLNDVLAVTLTDPLGNVMTTRSSKYVEAGTGRTSIGTTGGTVEGTGGVELRLPAGAVEVGTILKADFVDPSSLAPAQRPSLGEAHLTASIRIEAPSQPSFAKEVDLAFPKPAAAPAGAFYYVVRQVTGPEGRVLYQTVDTASVDGDKVVTNSYPFSGYDTSMGAFAYMGAGAPALLGVTSNMAFLLWAYDSLVPARAQMGVISGRVTRNQWNPVTRQWEYVPVAGAIVRRLVNGQDPFQFPFAGSTFSTTIGDGTYVILDALYTGGLVTVRATDLLSGQQSDATAYGMDPIERPIWAQHYRAVATANLAFTAFTAPRPQVTIRILERAMDAWQFSDGLVIADQPIVIGISVANATLESAWLDGNPLNLSDGAPGHLGLQKVAEQTIVETGAHTVVVRVRPETGSPVSETASFLVIAEGGDNNQILPDRAPEVIVPRLVPQPRATGVSPGIFPEVVFTEPVANVPGNVTVHELATDGSEGPALPVQLYGTGPQGAVSPLTFTAGSQVSALTIRPTGGLKYETKYRLKLAGTIRDLDSEQPGDPKKLVPYEWDFETFRSGTVGGTQQTFHSAGIVVLEDRAWVVQNQFLSGILRTFDVSDPVELKEVGEPIGIGGRPVDAAGETDSSAIPDTRRLLVLAQTVASQSRPSNLHVFDVSSDTPRRIGAASVTRSAVDGTLTRVEMKGRNAYAITWHKGVQVVDLLKAKENYDAEVRAYGDTVRMDELLARDGAGFGLDATVQTIRITKPHSGLPEQAPHWLLTDLKVGDYLYGGVAQPLVFITGELGFAMVNPNAGTWTMPATIQVGASRLLYGYALALGHVDDKDIALVVGTGQANHPMTGVSTSGPVLAVVNLSEILSPSSPPGPKVISVLPLFGASFALASEPTDVILKDRLAIVAGDRNAVIVDLSSLTAPQITGQIEGIGGRLASGEGTLVFGSAFSATGGQSEFGGIRSTFTGRIAIVTGHDPNPIVLSAANEVFTNVDLPYKVLPPDAEINSGTVQLAVRGGSTVTSLSAPVNPAGVGSATWPQGTIVNPLETYDARLRVVKDGQPLPSAPKRLRFATVPVAITTRDRMLRIQFALPEQGLFREKKYSVKVFLAGQGQAFPASPSFSIWSQEIEHAYPNTDVWWDDLRAGSERAEASWVTRKLDRMEMPPGTDTAIRRQAFEIGTVLAGYPKVKVVVVSDESGRELRVAEGVVTADGEWSAVLEKLNDRVRAAAGDIVPLEPILPAPYYYDPDYIFGRLRALNYRCALLLDNYDIVTQGGILRGMIDGFVAGVDGDKETVAMLKTAFTQNPVTTAKALKDFFYEVFAAFPSKDDLKRLVHSLYENSRYPTLDEAVMWAGEFAYYSGFLIGFVAEQALVGIAVAAVTAGVGELTKLAMNGLKAVGWIGRIVEEAAVVIRTLGYLLQAAARATRAPEFAKVCLTFARDSKQALVAFFRKYDKVDRILDRVTLVIQTSRLAAKRAIYWLSITDRMGEEAGIRFVTFFERKGQQAADAWLTRWTALRNGNRAVKDAFEATERAGEMADGAHDALVLAATVEHPVADLTYPKAFATKYGERLEGALLRLRASAEDTRFSDGIVGQTVRDLSDPKLPALSDAAVEGAAKSMLDCLM